MGDHPVLRPYAHPSDVPKAHQRFSGFDAGKAAVVLETIDERFHLENGWQVTEQNSSRPQRCPGAVDHLPRFRQIQYDPVELTFTQFRAHVAELDCPLRRVAEIAADVFSRQFGEILPDLIGG